MSEAWYLYRYSLSEPVLKGSVNKLDLTPGSDAELARFSLAGHARPIEVRMVADPKTDAWYGEWRQNKEKGFDFKWARLGEGSGALLVGHVSSKHDAAACDLFVATRSERTLELPADRASYDLRESFLTPLDRTALSKGGDLSVDRAGQRIVWRNPPTFTSPEELTEPKSSPAEPAIHEISDFSPFERGLKVGGRNRNGLELRLWLLPLDATGAVLATGSLHRQDLAEARPCRLGEPRCTVGLHGC